MKNYSVYILLCFLLGWNMLHAQLQNDALRFKLEGRVEVRNTGKPISGVSISNTFGDYVITNGLGEFEINTRIGDQLIIQHDDIETLRYDVQKNDDVLILVEDFDSSPVRSS
ncbi:MAG: hypothetical protein ABJI11_00410, partial [Maribacter sp.]